MIKHGKLINTTSYYDGVAVSSKNEYEISKFSTKESILRDVIDSMEVITKRETHKLTLEIVIDSKGRYRLVKKYLYEE